MFLAFNHNGSKSSESMIAYMPGAFLLLFGILVLLVPEILVILISSFFLISGVGMLLWTHRLRKMASEEKKKDYEIHIS